jgi:ribosomal protein S12 methylthiotransferase accessory factor
MTLIPQCKVPDGVALKRYLDGTHRLVSPTETVARLRPLLPAMGITRLANITGLDCIGIPTTAVYRPNSRSLSVSQGKGLTLDAARASGLMESAELYHAERIVLPLKLASYNELRFTHDLIDLFSLPRHDADRFHENLRILWVRGRDLMNGQDLWLPYECVHLDWTLPRPTGSGCFPLNSNGLASGNHPLEAILHGLCEVVERDAYSILQDRDYLTRSDARLDLTTVDDAACQELLERYRKAGVFVAVWNMTPASGIASFHCAIVDLEQDPWRPMSAFGGTGCHTERGIALSRALTEAAQSRLTSISGARDDISRDRHSLLQGSDIVGEVREKLVRRTPKVNFQQIPTFCGQTLEEDLTWLLERLQAAGIQQAVAVDLTREELRIPVVRIVVPGLRGIPPH